MRIKMTEDVGDFITIGGRKIPTDTSGYRDNASYDEIANDFARKYDDDQKAKAQEKAMSEKMAGYEEATSKYSETDDDEAYLEDLFDIFVPNNGVSDTFGGEIIRALCKLRYRFYNDGDMFNCGCDSSAENAAAYIYDVCCDYPTSDLVDIIESMAESCDERNYERGLKALIDTACCTFADFPDLFKEKNFDNYLDHQLPNDLINTEDVDLSYEGFSQYQDGVEDGYIDDAWVESFMSDFDDDLRFAFNGLSDSYLRSYRDCYVLEDVPFYLVDDVIDYFESSFIEACRDAEDEYLESVEEDMNKEE